MNIQFLGAAKTVTGSCFLVDTGNSKFLVDCGMFQGVEIEERNYERFDFDPKEIDFVLLTHSHLDHCGMLPKLVRDGFRGKIYATFPTRDIIEHILLDSAKVQEIRVREGKKARKNKNKWKLASSPKSLSYKKIIYNTPDVIKTLGQVESVAFKKTTKVAPKVKAEFLRAGHALGAASIMVEVEDGGKKKKILFSGDLGSRLRNLDTRFDYAKEADYVIMEALYGGRYHGDKGKEEKTFTDAINDTYHKGGKIYIPAFSLQRSQEVLYLIKQKILNGELPKNLRVYLDSPLAIKITDVYKKFYKYLNPKIVSQIKSGGELLAHRNIKFLKDAGRSRSLGNRGQSVYVAGNGMCAGGRILRHLQKGIREKRNVVLFVGYQAEGTLGREIVEGAKEIYIGNSKVHVSARIIQFKTFSAHADHDMLVKWVGKLNKDRLKKVFLVHAEDDNSLALEKDLEADSYDVEVPEWKEKVELSD